MSEFSINEAFGLTESAEDMKNRAANFFLNCKEAPGGCEIKKHEGTTALYGVAYRVVSPRDSSTGLATGRRIHDPIEVAGRADKASPKLFQFCAENKNLGLVKIEYWSAVTKALTKAGEGTMNTYNIELKNAVVCDFRHFTNVDGTLCFIAGFTFAEITLTWVNGGVCGSDQWLSST